MRSEPVFQALSSALPIRVPKLIERALGAAVGLSQLEEVYQSLASPAGESFLCSSLLERLRIRYRLSSEDLAQFPRTGATIVVANHPFGILDGAILLALLMSVRSDVKLLANRILNTIPELTEVLIPIDIRTGGSSVVQNVRALREAHRHLRGCGLLAVLPAGEVSHFQYSRYAVEDSPRGLAVARITAARSRDDYPTTIVPVHISGSNSLLFQTAGLFHPMLRTLLLARELMNKAGSEIDVQVGTPVSSVRLMALRSDEERTDYLRWRTYLLANRSRYKARTARPLHVGVRRVEPRTVISAIPESILSEEIAALGSKHMLVAAGDLQVFIARATRIPAILAEIGRLREITFRSVGEGSGESKDIDRFDEHYMHLFVWNSRKRQVIGLIV